MRKEIEEPMDRYLVSAIVSTYNSERFIRGCIEDLEAQSISDKVEIVVIDSASEQNEGAVIGEMQKRYGNIKYFRTESREPVYAAWNRAIRASSGKYITNANTDDRHRRDAFERMADVLESRPEVTLVYADVIITETENEVFDRCSPVGTFNWHDWDRNILLHKGCFMGPQPMWRRSVHDLYGYFDDSLITSGDYEFWLRISQTCDFYHLKMPLGLYLDSLGSIEHRNREIQQIENAKILSLYRSAAAEGVLVKFRPIEDIWRLIKIEGPEKYDASRWRDLLTRLDGLIDLNGNAVGDGCSVSSAAGEKKHENGIENGAVKFSSAFEKALETTDMDGMKLLVEAASSLILRSARQSKAGTEKTSESAPVSSTRVDGWEKNTADENLVSIIIKSTGEERITRRCLEKVRQHTREQYEIIFLTGGNLNGNGKWSRKLARQVDNCRFVPVDQRAGLVGGLNDAILKSSGSHIVLLDSSVEVSEGWLTRMLQCLNSQPGSGVVSPLSSCQLGFGKPRKKTAGVSQAQDDANASFGQRNLHRRIPSRRVLGSCMLFRRELVNRIGLFDEAFGSGELADDDFFIRSCLDGYRNFIAGDVLVRQSGSRSFLGTSVAPGSKRAVDRRIFALKWRGTGARSALGKKLIGLKATEYSTELNQRDEINKAVDMLLEGLKHCPEDGHLYYHLAEMLIGSKQFDGALEVLDQLPSANDDLRRLVITGYCMAGKEKYDEAVECADRILQADPSAPAALNLKGMLAWGRGEHEEARSFFSRAIDSDEGYGLPYTSLAGVKWAEGRREEALDLFEKGFVLCPTSMDIATAYHSAAIELGEHRRVESRLRDARLVYPENRRIRFLLIDVLLQQGSFQAAMEEIEEVMIDFGFDDALIAAALAIRGRIGPKEIANAKHPKLSVCMILKNEEQYLPMCLKSIQPVADEIIAVDTGSTDKTRAIAEIFGAKVFDFEWTADFSEARNFSLSKASGDWILALDGDEVISPLDHGHLLDLVRRKRVKPVAYAIITRNYVMNSGITGWRPNDGKYSREEAGTGWNPSSKIRLFPNRDGIRFENPVHELVEPSLERLNIEMKMCNVPVHHYGKLAVNQVEMKGEAYYDLGKKKLEETGGTLKSLIELAVQAGELHKHREAIDLWKKVVEAAPDYADAFMNMGYSYMELAEYKEGLQVCRKAMELNPNLKEACINYASCEIRSGDVKNTIPVLEDLVLKVPDYPTAMGLLGIAYSVDGQKKKGLEIFRKLSDMGYNCGEYLLEQANKLIPQGRTNYAAILLEAALENNDVSKDILALLSRCYAETGCVADIN
jgi:glycosyltransferase involved in cell wall biosynthesis/thioredoxin-like negative regulator of GroEL